MYRMLSFVESGFGWWRLGRLSRKGQRGVRRLSRSDWPAIERLEAIQLLSTPSVTNLPVANLPAADFSQYFTPMSGTGSQVLTSPFESFDGSASGDIQSQVFAGSGPYVGLYAYAYELTATGFNSGTSFTFNFNATPVAVDLTNSGQSSYAYQITGNSIGGMDTPVPTSLRAAWSMNSTSDFITVNSPQTSINNASFVVFANSPQTLEYVSVNASVPVVSYPESYVPQGGPPVIPVSQDAVMDVDSATTSNSHTILFTYNVEDANLDVPTQVAIYRSSRPNFTPATFNAKTDELIETDTLPATDTSNNNSDAVGQHTVAMNVNAGLPIDPKHEYVYAVADPNGGDPEVNPTDNSTHFRMFVLGAISHGFIPAGGLKSAGGGMPDWETQMQADLYADKYDKVDTFDWSSTSNIPRQGMAVAAGEKLAAEVEVDADALVQTGHPGDVVDLHLIGHSRGTVVISQAMNILTKSSDPVIAGGYKEMTFLDPHPANLGYAPKDYSSGNGTSASIAVKVYKWFERQALDPQVDIPSGVDQAELYYQQTEARKFSGAEAVLNLWGEAPGLIIKPQGFNLVTKDLTNEKINGKPVGHSEVPVWYDENVLKNLTN